VAAIAAAISLVPIVPSLGANWPIGTIRIDSYAKPAEMRGLKDIDVVNIANYESCYWRERRLQRAGIDVLSSSLDSHIKIKSSEAVALIGSPLVSRFFGGEAQAQFFQDADCPTGVFNFELNLDSALLPVNRNSALLSWAGEHIRPFVLAGERGGIDSGLCGSSRSSESAPQKISLRTEDQKLEENNSDGKLGEPKRIGIELSLFVMLFGLSLSLFCSFLGWKYLYNNRRVFGASLIGCCLLLCGLSLWWGTL